MVENYYLILDFKNKDLIFRFRCDDHSICEVSSEEVFKSEWFVICLLFFFE